MLAAPSTSSKRPPARATVGSERSDAIDLDARPSRERTRLDGRARRWRLLEIASVGFVDLGELSQVGDEDRRLHHLVEARAAGLEDRLQVLHHALGLRADVALDLLAGRRVGRDLTRHEEEGPRADADALAVGADGLRSLSALHGAGASAAGGGHALDLDARSPRQ